MSCYLNDSLFVFSAICFYVCFGSVFHQRHPYCVFYNVIILNSCVFMLDLCIHFKYVYIWIWVSCFARVKYWQPLPFFEIIFHLLSVYHHGSEMCSCNMFLRVFGSVYPFLNFMCIILDLCIHLKGWCASNLSPFISRALYILCLVFAYTGPCHG